MSETTTKEWEPQTKSGYDQSRPCDRSYCEHQVFEGALVPIEVGGVTEYWCPDCVNEEFGVSMNEVEQGVLPRHLITARTVAAFTAGLLVAAIVFSVLVV